MMLSGGVEYFLPMSDFMPITDIRRQSWHVHFLLNLIVYGFSHALIFCSKLGECFALRHCIAAQDFAHNSSCGGERDRSDIVAREIGGATVKIGGGRYGLLSCP
jgi:hypothetical protein